LMWAIDQNPYIRKYRVAILRLDTGGRIPLRGGLHLTATAIFTDGWMLHRTL
jgi:hypothetical protein